MTQIPLPMEGVTAEITLTKGYTAIIDSIDADLAFQKWTAQKEPHTVYARRKIQKKNVHLHRVILERMLGRHLNRREVVDHIDGNGLNNRRSNLRVATQSQNSANRKGQTPSISGYRGVTWSKKEKKWRAQITVNCRHINIGCFDTPEEAYEAYCKSADKFFGEFWRTQ